MAEELDEFGIPIKRTKNKDKDEFGVPIKKKSTSTISRTGSATNGGISRTGGPTWANKAQPEQPFDFTTAPVPTPVQENPFPVNITLGNQQPNSLTPNIQNNSGFMEDIAAATAGTRSTSQSRRLNELNNTYDQAQGAGSSQRILDMVKQSQADPLGVGESMANSFKNFANRLQGTIPRLQVVSADIWENVLGEELAKKAYEFEGRDIDIVRNEALNELEALREEILPTWGIVSSIEDNNWSGLAAATVNTITSLGSSMIPALATGGAGTFTEMTGDALVDYNTEKAKRLGLSVNELYAQNKADFDVPAMIGAAGGAMELIGLSGVKNLITKKITGSGFKKGLIYFAEANKEGLTEVFQSGLEAANKAIGQGKSAKEADEAFTNAVFSKNGLENYLGGLIGSVGAGGLGRLASLVNNPEAKASLSEEIAKVNLIEMDLQKPGISEQSRETLNDMAKSSISNVAEIIDQEDIQESKLKPEQQAEVSRLGEQASALEAVLADPGVSSEIKADVQTQLDDVNSQLEIAITPEQASVDESVKTFQERFPEQIPDIMEDVPDTVVRTVERMESGAPMDIVQIEEASNWLYNKYKQLSAMKQSHSRRVTIDQINSVQEQISQDIQALEQKKTENFNDKSELDNASLIELDQTIEQAQKISEENKQLAEMESDPVLKQESLDAAAQADALIEMANEELSSRLNPEINEVEQNIPAEENVVRQETVETAPEVIEETSMPRTLQDVEADIKSFQRQFNEAVKLEGLYDQAREGTAPQELLDDIQMQVEDSFGKTVQELRAERQALQDSVSPEITEEQVQQEDVTPVQESKPKVNPEERSTADKIRSLKSKKGKLYDGVIGIPVAIWDGALETVATAVEAGTSIAEAIKKAVEYIKKNSNNKNDAEIENEINRTFEDAGITLKGLQEENVIPEVIDEIEQSPEEITAENIQEFKKRLDRLMKNSRTTALIKNGIVKADSAFKAVQLVSEINDRKSMLAAARSVKKLFDNVVKNAYMGQIKKAKSGLQTRLKNSKLGKTDLLKKFLKIDENSLQQRDLETYNSMVRLLDDQYNSRLDGVVADSEIQAFVDKIADQKAKDILNEQLGETEEVQEESGEVKESPRRKQLNAVTALNRKALRQGGYNQAFKPVAQALLNVDTETLSNSQLRNLNIALINLAVNDRLVGHEQVFREYTGKTGLQTLSARVGQNVRGLLNNALGASARSLDVNSKIIFKGVKDSALFQSLSGIAGISNGNSKVANLDMKSFERNYKSQVDSLKFQDYNSTENRFLRSLYSIATQFSGIGKEAADFKRYKSLIKQSAEKLIASKEASEQREGQLRMDQFNEYLEPYDNRTDFEDNFKVKQDKNVKVVEFFRKQFADKLDEFSLNTLIYGGKNLKRENNYLSISWKKYSGTVVKEDLAANNLVEPVYDFDPETGDVSERQSSTSIARTNKTQIKNSDRILNMDFDRYIFDKYREMNYDIRTMKDRHLYNSIKDQEGFQDLVGSANNSNILTKGVVNMVKRQMGQGAGKSDIDALVRASRVLSAKGVRQALFGVSQAIKQYPSVALRTIINLNKDAGLFFKGVGVGANNPIFDNFGVGLRGSTRGGTNYELELNNIRKSDFSSSMGKLINAANRASEITARKLAYSLSAADEAVAKHSWIAYYLKHIRDNGGDIGKVDWETEHLNPNMEAGAYADLMVSTTQNVNDNSKQADLLYDTNDAKTILRDVVAPFSGFARNAQANLEADLRTFSEGTPAEKKAAAWGILSTVSEQAAFNAIKTIVIANLVTNSATLLMNLFGVDDEDKDYEVKVDTPKVLKNTASDILFGGLGQLGTYWSIKGVNQLNKAVQGNDKDLFFQYNPAQFGEPDFGMAGMYGILPQTLYNAGEKMDYAGGSVTGFYKDRKGNDIKATSTLSDKDQRLALGLFIIDALAIAGVSDAEISRINQTMFRDIKKRNQPVKSFRVTGKNSKADVETEVIDDEE